MKTELLTFQTTVRVTYSNPQGRKAAISTARDVMNAIGSMTRASVVYGCITVTPKRSVYRPKVSTSDAPVRTEDSASDDCTRLLIKHGLNKIADDDPFAGGPGGSSA